MKPTLVRLLQKNVWFNTLTGLLMVEIWLHWKWKWFSVASSVSGCHTQDSRWKDSVYDHKQRRKAANPYNLEPRTRQCVAFLHGNYLNEYFSVSWLIVLARTLHGMKMLILKIKDGKEIFFSPSKESAAQQQCWDWWPEDVLHLKMIQRMMSRGKHFNWKNFIIARRNVQFGSEMSNYQP